jgi:hypothetical protein
MGRKFIAFLEDGEEFEFTVYPSQIPIAIARMIADRDYEGIKVSDIREIY